MASRQSSSIFIDASHESVWNLLTTADGIPDWYDNWNAVEHDDLTDGKLGVGAIFSLVRHTDGGDRTAACHVTVADAPNTLTWLERAEGCPVMRVEFRIEPSQTGGCVLTIQKRY